MLRALVYSILFIALFLVGWGHSGREGQSREGNYPVQKSEKEWKEELGEKAFQVLRNGGTERAFTGDYWDHKDQGTYVCRGCQQELFHSSTKFNSGTGWPSYFEPVNDSVVQEIPDNSLGMSRVEVRCSRCGGHLGHVFEDGPHPTGRRYCINSISMDFKKE